MAGGAEVAELVASRYAVLRPHPDERQRRLLLGVEAQQLGRGGIATVAEATGVHPATIARGVREVEGVPESSVRVTSSTTSPQLISPSTPLRSWRPNVRHGPICSPGHSAFRRDSSKPVRPSHRAACRPCMRADAARVLRRVTTTRPDEGWCVRDRCRTVTSP